MIKYLSQKLVKAFAVVALAGLTGVADAQTFNWSQAGPIYNAGRARNMIIDKNDLSGNTLYVGSASSGVFISTDGGVNWNALTLSGNKLNVSYLAQAIDGTIYVATGEGFLRPGQKAKAQPGTGLYKIAAGTLSLVASDLQVGSVINRVACSPSDPNKIAIATNLGIMISTNGSSFSLAAGITTASTISGQDVKFDNSGILYCSAGSENSAPTVGSKVFKSTDNSLSNFLPLTTLNSPLLQDDYFGRIELAIAPSNNSVIYASCASKYSGGVASANLKGLFVSYDAGATWGLILQGSNQLDPLANGGTIASGDYAQVITVSPFNADRLYIGGYQFYTWIRTGGNNSNPVGTWNKYGYNTVPNSQLYLSQNIHDIKLITSGSSISKYFFVTDAGIYRSSDGLLSFQPFYKGLITGQFNSVSIERYPLAAVPAANGSSVTPYSGFIGGTGGNGLNYFSGNYPLVTKEVAYSSGDIYQSEFSKILPNAAYFASGPGKLFRTTDVRSSDPTQLDLVKEASKQTIVPFDNSIYSVYNSTGTPFKLWESYGQTTVSPDSAVFYNDTLRFSASMQGVATLTTQTTFSFSAARPNANALIDSIVVRTGTVVLPISAPGCYAPGFTGSDKKDITIKLSNGYTVAPTGTTSPAIGLQTGPVTSTNTSVLLNASTLLDNISVTFTSAPFASKTTATLTGVSDCAAYYRVFCTVFYKYKVGDVVSVIDNNISTKTYTYTTALTQPLSWGYGSTLNTFTMNANTVLPVSNPTYVLSYAGGTVGIPQTSPTFTLKPVVSTAYTITSLLGSTYTISAKPITYVMTANSGTVTVLSPTYNLMPDNITQSTPIFTLTPTPTTSINYTIFATGSNTSTQTYSTIGSPTYVLNPGNITQTTSAFVVTPTVQTTYTLQGISSNTSAAINTSTTNVFPVTTFSTIGYGSTPPLAANNPQVKMAKVSSARIALGFGPNVYVSNAPLNLNNPLNLINISSNKCLTTDNLGNKAGVTNTVAVTGTITALEWSKAGTELYYATNDLGTGNTFLYRVSYIDALLDSTSVCYSGKLHTNVFTYSTSTAPNGSKNNPRSPYRTTLLGTFTKQVTSISVTKDDKAIAVTFDDATGAKIKYSTIADVRKCDYTNIVLADRSGTGLNVSKVYCSLMEQADNKKVFVGTDLGVYYTADITASSPTWVDANNSQLPIIQVFDLKQQVLDPWNCYNAGVIYAATNGRGIFINKQFANATYVSVEEKTANKTENNLSLYPNPTNGNVFVSFNGIDGESATINVMDINGRIIKKENLGKLSNGQINYAFETSDLASGMYIVSINSDSGTKRVAKLVVTK
jgi:hypothetical protein